MGLRDVDVLIVEDQPSDGELTLKALYRDGSNIRTALVPTGAAAIQYLAMHHPKAVLLDMSLPNSDAIRVLKEIRRNPQTQFTPVLVLIGSPDERRSTDLRLLGVNGYISKSTDVNVLADHFAVFKHLICPAKAAGSEG